MKYLCLAYGAEKDWTALTVSEQSVLLEQDAVICRRGATMAAVQNSVSTVRAWDGVPVTTDAAFSTSSVPLAGFSIIEATDLNEVVGLVARTPCARAKGAIEVRPILIFHDAERVGNEPVPMARDTPAENAMRLYEFAPTRSIRVRWTLQELEVGFAPITVNLVAGEHQSPAFLKINPAAKIPVLVDGDLVLTESVAIVLYLAEKYSGKGLIPTDLKLRAQVNRWLLFAATELEQPLWRIARHTALYPEHLRLIGEVALAQQDFKEMAPVLEGHMQGRRFVVGDSFTVADIVGAYTLDWANEVGLLNDFPCLLAYMERMYARPNAAPRIATALASIKGNKV
jgi:glutathione S-transferase